MLLKDEVYQIVGCAIEVLNTLGHGLLEKPYENALVVEFGLNGVHVHQQQRFDVYYKSEKVGDYIPDLIVFDKIIVETKTIDRITNLESGQVLNYLKIIGLRVGVVLNLKHAKLEWELDQSEAIHARHIVTDHGWKILLDRGLDIFQRFEMNEAFTFANRLQQFRPCKAFEVTYLKT